MTNILKNVDPTVAVGHILNTILFFVWVASLIYWSPKTTIVIMYVMIQINIAVAKVT